MRGKKRVCRAERLGYDSGETRAAGCDWGLRSGSAGEGAIKQEERDEEGDEEVAKAPVYIMHLEAVYSRLSLTRLRQAVNT